jgi:transcription elongation GreA/GreB family factor
MTQANEKPIPFTKRQVLDQVQAYLADELSGLVEQANASGKDLPSRAEELRQQLVMYRFLPIRDYGEEDVVCAGGLVELEHNKTRAFYLLVPQGGGLVTTIDGFPIQVITPKSPLGEALLGRKRGDLIKVWAGGKDREYRVVGYY